MAALALRSRRPPSHEALQPVLDREFQLPEAHDLERIGETARLGAAQMLVELLVTLKQLEYTV